MEHIAAILDVFSKAGGIAGLVILLLFVVVFRHLSDVKDKINDLALQAEENKNELSFQIEKTKACVLKIMYEFNMVQDRRRRDNPVKVERRHDSPGE